jgi:hypothetical protein
MKYVLQMLFAVVAAFLAICRAEEVDIENHPAFKVDEIPTPFNSLRVAAFNIQVFGVTKMGKPEVVNCLKQVNKLKATTNQFHSVTFMLTLQVYKAVK